MAEYKRIYNANNILTEEYYEINGIKEGLSTHYCDDGTLHYTYNYVNGKKHGIHKVFYVNGNINVICSYIDDKIEGECIVYRSNGRIYKTQIYVNDEMNGKCVDYSYTNDIYDICEIYTFINGKKNGIYELYANKKLKGSCFYVDDKFHGEYKEYDENGELIKSYFYVNGNITK